MAGSAKLEQLRAAPKCYHIVLLLYCTPDLTSAVDPRGVSARAHSELERKRANEVQPCIEAAGGQDESPGEGQEGPVVVGFAQCGSSSVSDFSVNLVRGGYYCDPGVWGQFRLFLDFPI